MGQPVRAEITDDETPVEVVTRGPDARPVPNVPLRLEIRIGGAVVDFGRLSNKTPITGACDRAARASLATASGVHTENGG